MPDFYCGSNPTFRFDLGTRDDLTSLTVLFSQGDLSIEPDTYIENGKLTCRLVKSETASFSSGEPISVLISTSSIPSNVVASYSLTTGDNDFSYLEEDEELEEADDEYEPVDPDGDEDPYVEKWYVISGGSYVRASERTVDFDTEYYLPVSEVYSEFPSDILEGEEGDDMFVKLDDELSVEGVSPQDEGWYELSSDLEYVPSLDQSVEGGKSYYATVNDEDGFEDEYDEFESAFDGEAFLADNGLEDLDEGELDDSDDDEWDESDIFEIDDIDEDLVSYRKVTPSSGSIPVDEGWMELVNGEYEVSADNSVVSGKEYYEVVVTLNG